MNNYRHLAIGGMAAAAAATGEGDVPLLVRVLAGNSVTSTIVLSCLNTADATRLRCLHPAMPAVVARVPWSDLGTDVVDAARWRTCFPAAVRAWLTERAANGLLLASKPALVALDGVAVLVFEASPGVTDDLLLRLPTSLHTLNVRYCRNLTGDASFAHLTALTLLYCSGTAVLSKRADGLPGSARPWVALTAVLSTRQTFWTHSHSRLLPTAGGATVVVQSINAFVQRFRRGNTNVALSEFGGQTVAKNFAIHDYINGTMLNTILATN